MATLPSEGSLLAHTRSLLQHSTLTYLQIYQDTGLSPNWLSALACDRIKAPNVNRIQRLHEYLTGEPLRVRA